MRKQLIVGALSGGVVLFLWASVSHMLLTWYEPHLRTFTDQAAVEHAVVTTVSGSGLYLLPNLTPQQQSLARAEKRAAMEALQERFDRGPLVLAVVRVGSGTSFPVRLTTQFVLFVLASLVATWLLLQARLASYRARATFVAALAVPVVLAAKIPQWNWWDYPVGFITVESLDVLVGWALLGLVLGRLVRPMAAE